MRDGFARDSLHRQRVCRFLLSLAREHAALAEPREPRAFAAKPHFKPDRENPNSRYSPPTRPFFSRGLFPQCGLVVVGLGAEGEATRCLI